MALENNRLSENDVRLAFELLLGRAAESAGVVRDHLSLGSLAALRDAIMSSPEFQSKMLQSHFSSGSKWVAVDVLDCFTQWIDLHDRFVSHGCLNNDWEPSETAYFISRLNAGDTVLDIGANIGWFSLLAAKHTGRHGRVHAFEPRPETVHMLKRTIADNNLGRQVTVWDYALSDKWEKLKLAWGKGTDNPGGSFLSDLTETGGRSYDSADVTAALLDDLLPEVAPDIIKIDVEGAEPRALRGARNAILRKRPAILSELFPAQLMAVSGMTPAQYIDQLARLGYSCYLLENGVPTRNLVDFPAGSSRELVSVVFECSGPGTQTA